MNEQATTKRHQEGRAGLWDRAASVVQGVNPP